MAIPSGLRGFRDDHGLSLGLAAERLGVNRSTFFRWETGRVLVPAERVIEIERITGVSRKELRPDLYPPLPSHLAPQPGEAA